VLDLRPDPPHEIDWLDLRTAPGGPATRIRLDPLDPQIPAPEVTVTRMAHSPGTPFGQVAGQCAAGFDMRHDSGGLGRGRGVIGCR
jgi:hypothetical protein